MNLFSTKLLLFEFPFFHYQLVLVKHVLSSISAYWMRSLILPKDVNKKIISICRSFFWAGVSSSKKELSSLKGYLSWKRARRSRGKGLNNVLQ